MSKYFLISGYYIDDKTDFTDYLVKEFEDIDENDDDVFYYGLSELDIQKAIEHGENTREDFVITSYKEVITNEKIDYKTLKDLFAELDEQAKELIDCGDSKEKAEGYGMQKVTTAIYMYCKKNKIKL
jgi:hypothetical protein